MKKLTIILFSVLFSQSLFAGYTYFEKDRLVFGNGGAFELATSGNTTMIQVENLTPGEGYKSKGIEIAGNVYDIFPTLYPKAADVAESDFTLPHYVDATSTLLESDEAPDADVIFIEFPLFDCCHELVRERSTVNPFYSTVSPNVNFVQHIQNLGNDSDKRDYFSTTNGGIGSNGYPSFGYKANMIVGDMSSRFLSFYAPKVSNYGDVDGETVAINSYQVYESENEWFLDPFEPLYMSTNGAPVYFGDTNSTEKEGVPIMSVVPRFRTDVDSEEYDSRVAINMVEMPEAFSVSGNVKLLGGSYLLARDRVGVIEQDTFTRVLNTSDTEVSTSLSGGATTVIDVKFDVNYVSHNLLVMGQVNSVPASNVDSAPFEMWLKFGIKTGDGSFDSLTKLPGDVSSTKDLTKRYVPGGSGQNKFAGITSYIGQFPANQANLNAVNSTSYSSSSTTTYYGFLKIDPISTSGDKVVLDPDSDQSQVLVFGLPADKLQSDVVQNATTSTEIPLTTLEVTTVDKPYFKKDYVALGPEGGMVGLGANLVFTNGEEYIPLKVESIDANGYYDVDVLKIIHESTTGNDGKTLLAMGNFESDGDNAPALYFDVLDNDGSLADGYGFYGEGIIVSHNIRSRIGTLNINERGSVIVGDGAEFSVQNGFVSIGDVEIDTSKSSYMEVLGGFVFSEQLYGSVGNIFYAKCGGGYYSDGEVDVDMKGFSDVECLVPSEKDSGHTDGRSLTVTFPEDMKRFSWDLLIFSGSSMSLDYLQNQSSYQSMNGFNLGFSLGYYFDEFVMPFDNSLHDSGWVLGNQTFLGVSAGDTSQTFTNMALLKDVQMVDTQGKIGLFYNNVGTEEPFSDYDLRVYHDRMIYSGSLHIMVIAVPTGVL